MCTRDLRGAGWTNLKPSSHAAAAAATRWSVKRIYKIFSDSSFIILLPRPRPRDKFVFRRERVSLRPPLYARSRRPLFVRLQYNVYKFWRKYTRVRRVFDRKQYYASINIVKKKKKNVVLWSREGKKRTFVIFWYCRPRVHSTICSKHSCVRRTRWKKKNVL